MKLFDFIKQALIFMALGVGSGFLGVGTLRNEGKPNAPRRRQQGDEQGAAAARGPGLAAAAAPGAASPPHSPAAPARQGRCLGSAAFRAPQL